MRLAQSLLVRRMATRKKKKGMGIKSSVKSGNFRPTKKGAGMTAKGVAAYRRANPGSKLKTAVTGQTNGKLLKEESHFVTICGSSKMHNINCERHLTKESVKQGGDGNVRCEYDLDED